jgi:hypothetical protein
MSAIMYKKRLETALTALSQQAVAAREWRDIAEDRLAGMEALDKMVCVAAERVKDLGGVLGVELSSSATASSPTPDMDPIDIYKICFERLEAFVDFTIILTEEAHSTVGGLDETLKLLEAVSPIAAPVNQGATKPLILGSAKVSERIYSGRAPSHHASRPPLTPLSISVPTPGQRVKVPGPARSKHAMDILN